MLLYRRKLKMVKLSPWVTDYVLHHEDVWRKWLYTSTHFWLGYLLEVSRQIHTPTALLPEEATLYTLERRLSGLQNRSERREE
jgi:hypothetical protein